MPRAAIAPADSLLLTYEAAAALLSCGLRTVERLVAAGRLRPVFLTGRRSPRIHVDELRRFADEAYAEIVEAALAEPSCEPPTATNDDGDGPLVRNVHGQVVRLAAYRPAAESVSRHTQKARGR